MKNAHHYNEPYASHPIYGPLQPKAGESVVTQLLRQTPTLLWLVATYFGNSQRLIAPEITQ